MWQMRRALAVCTLAAWALPGGAVDAGERRIVKEFYIYDDPVMRLPPNCRVYWPDWEDSALLSALEEHPDRTMDPASATLFVFPLHIASLHLCPWPGKDKHLQLAEDALAASPWFQASGGRDHLIFGRDWRFTAERSGPTATAIRSPVFRELIQTRFENHGVSYYDWGGTSQASSFGQWLAVAVIVAGWLYFATRVAGTPTFKLWGGRRSKGLIVKLCVGVVASIAIYNLPALLFPVPELWEATRRAVVTPYWQGPKLGVVQPSYEDWSRRSRLLFFHTGNRAYKDERAHRLRHLFVASADKFPRSSIGYTMEDQEAWIAGWSNSRFCPVLAGDTPSSHSFARAVASGCIPVIISDQFEKVGMPFKSTYNLHAFALQMTEDDFEKQPTALLERIKLDDKTTKRLLDNLAEAQKGLLYHVPDSTLVDAFLREVDAIMQASQTE